MNKIILLACLLVSFSTQLHAKASAVNKTGYTLMASKHDIGAPHTSPSSRIDDTKSMELSRGDWNFYVVINGRPSNQISFEVENDSANKVVTFTYPNGSLKSDFTGTRIE